MDSTKGHSKATKSGELEVIPRSDFQTALPKELGLEGVPGLREGAPYSNLPSAALFACFIKWQTRIRRNLKHSCAAEKYRCIKSQILHAKSVPKGCGPSTVAPASHRMEGKTGLRPWSSGRGKGSFCCH